MNFTLPIDIEIDDEIMQGLYETFLAEYGSTPDFDEDKHEYFSRFADAIVDYAFEDNLIDPYNVNTEYDLMGVIYEKYD